jgi:hypothetical protein
VTFFDPSFRLYFARDANDLVVERLAGLLRAEDADVLKRPAPIDARVVFRLPVDEALREWADAHREMQQGSLDVVDIGVIAVTLEPVVADLGGGAIPMLRLDLVPLTKRMGRCCAESEQFRRALVECLESCDGIVAHLDAGDGSVTSFWQRDG